MPTKRLLVLSLMLILLAAALPAAAGPVPLATPAENLPPPPTGTAGWGGDFIISTELDHQMVPAIAYNSTDNEYLVVWDDLREGQYDIYGQIYAADGLPQGEALAICSNASAQLTPVVDYNAIDNEYMVVWTDYRGGNADVYGRTVNADGTFDGSDFAINEDQGEQLATDVAHNPDPASDDYLVVWTDVGEAQAEGLLLDNLGAPIGNVLVIASGATNPAAVHNSHLNSYLVVFQDEAIPGDFQVGGRAIHADGMMDAAFAICQAAGNQTLPDVAFNTVSQEYLVVWQDGRDDALTDVDLYARRVAENDALLGSEIVVSQIPDNQLFPALTYNPQANQYLVVWHDNRNYASTSTDVYGRRIKADGTPTDQGQFVIASNSDIQGSPAVAYSSAAHQYMVVWEDDRSGVKDIYGQRLHWLGFAQGYEFIVSAASESHADPDVVLNTTWTEYLVVWADDRDGDGAEDIFGQRYSRYGTPLGENFLVNGEASREIGPVATYNSAAANYLVIWENPVEQEIHGRIVSAQGTLPPPTWSFDYGPGTQPAVAYDPSTEQYLLVYSQSNPDTGKDIRGFLLGADGAGHEQFDICNHTGDQLSPAIAFDEAANRYLVVWTDARDDSGDIRGVAVAADGSLGAEMEIAAAADAQTNPDLAWNSAQGGYLVVWHDYRNSGASGADIYGQVVNSVGMPQGTETLISDAAGDQQLPYVNYITTTLSPGGRYYVGWQSHVTMPAEDYDLYSRWVAADGSLASATLPAFTYSGWQMHPAGAYNAADEQGIMVWEDGRNGEAYKIVGRLGILDLEPPTARFTREPTAGQVGTSFTLDARSSSDNATPSSLLLVCWDWDWPADGCNTLLSLNKVLTITPTNPGVYTLTLTVQDLMLLTDTIAYPIYVLPGSANTPPVASLVVTPTLVTAGDSVTLDASASHDAQTPPANLVARWDWENDGIWDTGWGSALTQTHAYTVASDYSPRVEIRDAGNLTDAASDNVTVVPAAATGLTVDPGLVMLQRGEAFQFRATAWDVHGNRMPNPSVTWSVLDLLAGTINGGGLFTASDQTGTYTDTVRAASGELSANATVIIWETTYKLYLPLVMRSY